MGLTIDRTFDFSLEREAIISKDPLKHCGISMSNIE